MNESQIRRYSRQILLAEVGGEGTRILLHSKVLLCGGGSALSVAAAYLAGGGTQIEEAPQSARDPLASNALSTFDLRPSSSHSGFLAGLKSWAEFNPDALPQEGEVALTLSEAVVPAQGGKIWVALGGGNGQAEIWILGPGSCPECARLSAGSLSSPVPPEWAVVAGSVAALAVQRLLLGWEQARWRGLGVGPEGVRELPRVQCPLHAKCGSL